MEKESATVGVSSKTVMPESFNIIGGGRKKNPKMMPFNSSEEMREEIPLRGAATLGTTREYDGGQRPQHWRTRVIQR